MARPLEPLRQELLPLARDRNAAVTLTSAGCHESEADTGNPPGPQSDK